MSRLKYISLFVYSLTFLILFLEIFIPDYALFKGNVGLLIYSGLFVSILIVEYLKRQNKNENKN